MSPHEEDYLQILGTGKWNDEQGPNVSSADQTDGYVEEMGKPGVVLANFVEDTPTVIATAALLANDTDVDGGPLFISAVDATNTHGTLVLAGGLITYTPSANFNGADQFSYTVSDGHGGTATGTLGFNVAAVNDAPVETVPGAQSVNENTNLVFIGASAITISDVDVLPGTPGTENVTLSVTHGTLTLDGTAGLSFTTGDGTGDAKMTFTGSVTDINNALNGLTYLGNNNFHGNDTLIITTNDLGHTGSGGAQTTTQQVALTVTPTTDDTPVIGTDQLVVSDSHGGANTPTTVTGLYVTDPGAGSSETFTLTATTAGAPGTTVTPSSETGSLSAVNTDLSSITYTPGGNPPATDMVTFTVAGQSASDTVHFVFNQGGSGQGVTLTGTAGKDVIFGSGNGDTLTGGGGQDQFVFSPNSNQGAAPCSIRSRISTLTSTKSMSGNSAISMPGQTLPRPSRAATRC